MLTTRLIGFHIKTGFLGDLVTKNIRSIALIVDSVNGDGDPLIAPDPSTFPINDMEAISGNYFFPFEQDLTSL